MYFIRAFFKFFLLVVFSFSYAHAENDKAFFWKVTAGDDASNLSSGSAIVYLMGSIHFADKSFYPLRQEIETAFQQSDSLAVELDINNIDQQMYNRLLMKNGIYTDGRTIKDVISEETWLQLRQRLRHLDIPYDSVKLYKPGMLVLTLSAIQITKLGLDPALGIDAHFLSKAAQINSFKPRLGKIKNIIELETLEQQLNLFFDIPDGDLLLKESLYSLDESELLLAEIVRYWKAGDEKKMNKMLIEDALAEYPAFSAIYDSLFYDRNDKMVIKIEEMLKQSQGSYFVVVGSAHLIGEKGIVSSLKGKGYKVERR